MNWFFSKSKSTPQPKTPATVDSIKQKLSGYQPKSGKSDFTGPVSSLMGDFFEYEKVTIDPDASGFHHVPFHC
ncbi:hypothetical protein [Ketobacter alkanivorans]|uniref:Uncharacterized protein n=1 Tax=Ketobacter alkanivorans TaxID=1917421 RepID=A0A2K9LN18_9GAMM|nr:hypothetical protein [Ketobacter alkanivorans]AUM12875.1 hypothetical protein Kalk_10770 [Ketobacter alkanivorans]MCP5014503.1 hypothetical protein [Ketobacter sp.]